METAFRQIGIECDSKTVDTIFRITDGDMNGKIACKELQQLYTEVVRETEIDDY